MSENARASSSMASVWDTLNKMKARQKAAENHSRNANRYDAARRDAILLFEHQLQLALSSNVLDGASALRDMRVVMDDDQNVRTVIDHHKERLKSLPLPQEFAAVRQLLNDTSNLLLSARACATKAQRMAQPLKT